MCHLIVYFEKLLLFPAKEILQEGEGEGALTLLSRVNVFNSFRGI